MSLWKNTWIYLASISFTDQNCEKNMIQLPNIDFVQMYRFGSKLTQHNHAHMISVQTWNSWFLQYLEFMSFSNHRFNFRWGRTVTSLYFNQKHPQSMSCACVCAWDPHCIPKVTQLHRQNVRRFLSYLYLLWDFLDFFCIFCWSYPHHLHPSISHSVKWHMESSIRQPPWCWW